MTVDVAKKTLTPADEPFDGQPRGHERWTEEHFRALIEYAWKFRMSDIKLIPDYPPFIRVYGKWHTVNSTPVASMDIDLVVSAIAGSESLPSRVRGGEFADFAYEARAGRSARRRFRCNASGIVLPGGLTGISLVLRTIPETIPTLEAASLVINGKPSPILRNMFPAQGIVLFTGPTGSGKTTTLAAGIGYLLRVHPELSVETYEDPVEFDYRTARGKGPLAQMSVSEHLQGDFQKIAPNAARRSSDVVIVGETRDKASFRGLIQLADMGMLTISTLHTRSVAETPSRILNTFSADEQPEIKASLIHGLRFVVQQRLLPTVDGKRVAVREHLVFSESIRYELTRQKTEEMIPFLRAMTREHGQPLINDVYAKYKAGIIDRMTFKRMEAEHDEASRAGGEGEKMGFVMPEGVLPRGEARGCPPLKTGAGQSADIEEIRASAAPRFRMPEGISPKKRADDGQRRDDMAERQAAEPEGHAASGKAQPSGGEDGNQSGAGQKTDASRNGAAAEADKAHPSSPRVAQPGGSRTQDAAKSRKAGHQPPECGNDVNDGTMDKEYVGPEAESLSVSMIDGDMSISVGGEDEGWSEV